MADASLTGFSSLPYDFQLLNLLMGLFSPNASTPAQALGGAKAAGVGAELGGNALGYSGLADVGKGLGTAAGLAGAGYNLANIARSNASTENKIGGGIESGGEAAAAYALPYGWLPGIATALGGQLQRSGSPQIQATGRGLTSAGQPIPTNPFSRANVSNPAPELRGLGTSLMVGGPGGSALLNAIGVDPTKYLSKIMPGIFHEPTTGTKFRHELDSIYDRIPAFKGTDTSKYNIDPEAYNKFDAKTRAQADLAGGFLGSYAPDFQKNGDAYTTQAANTLLNRYGSNIPNFFGSTGMNRDSINKALAARNLPDPLMNRFASDLATLGI